MAKRNIPSAIRRAIALRHGCSGPHQTVEAQCHYCGAPGKIHWANRSWVALSGLEFDHVIPEFHGGESVVDNIVLACRRCNRSKGHRLDWTPE